MGVRRPGASASWSARANASDEGMATPVAQGDDPGTWVLLVSHSHPGWMRDEAEAGSERALLRTRCEGSPF